MPVIFDKIDALVSGIQISIRQALRDNEYLKYDDSECLNQTRREQLNNILDQTYKITEILMK